jgi:hypothetical protein
MTRGIVAFSSGSKAEGAAFPLNFIFLAVSAHFAGGYLCCSAKAGKDDGKAKALQLGQQPVCMCEFAKSAPSDQKRETRNCE